MAYLRGELHEISTVEPMMFVSQKKSSSLSSTPPKSFAWRSLAVPCSLPALLFPMISFLLCLGASRLGKLLSLSLPPRPRNHQRMKLVLVGALALTTPSLRKLRSLKSLNPN